MSMVKRCFAIAMISMTLAGCGGSGNGPKIVSTKGTVTFKGAPLADATVILSPEKGPVAMGVTNSEGKFTLATGATRGAAVGKARVAVSIPSTDGGGSATSGDQPKDAKSGAEMMRNMGKAQFEQTKTASDAAKKAKSLLPTKYSSTETSGLWVTIEEDASKNDLSLKLE